MNWRKYETDAQLCRRKRWKVGAILEGNEGYGSERILLTAVGEEAILARRIVDRFGKPTDDSESLWTLRLRNWKKVGQQ